MSRLPPMAFGRNQGCISISVMGRARPIGIVRIVIVITMMIASDMSAEEDTVIGATPGAAIPVALAIPSKTVCASRIGVIESSVPPSGNRSRPFRLSPFLAMHGEEAVDPVTGPAVGERV